MGEEIVGAATRRTNGARRNVMDDRQDGKHRVAIDVREDITVVLSESEVDEAATYGTSRYVRRSANLPHLGDAKERDIVDEMETLRRTKAGRRRRQAS